MEQGVVSTRWPGDAKYVCLLWLINGCRYLMYIHCEEEIYMLDRDNSVFLVPQLKFFSRKRKNDHIFETLVDGVSPMML